MCMRQTNALRSAAPTSSGSPRSAVTSFPSSAPSSSARRHDGLRRVDREGNARSPRSTGVTRRSSSSAETGAAPGEWTHRRRPRAMPLPTPSGVRARPRVRVREAPAIRETVGRDVGHPYHGRPRPALLERHPLSAHGAQRSAVETARKFLPSTHTGNTGPLGQRRGIGFGILLFIVTLGIYSLYWVFKTQDEVKEHSGQGVGGVLGLVIYIVVSIVSWFSSPVRDREDVPGRTAARRLSPAGPGSGSCFRSSGRSSGSSRSRAP